MVASWRTLYWLLGAGYSAVGGTILNRQRIATMVYKTNSSVPGHVRVVFELPGTLWADRVFVVGNFDQGQPRQIPLQPLADRWQAALDLPAGQQYHFHYSVDGEWRTEYQADGFVNNAGKAPDSLLAL
jgi:Glycogen recognition site of AMP-activated protein kinase